MINIDVTHALAGLTWVYCTQCQHSINEPMTISGRGFLVHILEKPCKEKDND